MPCSRSPSFTDRQLPPLDPSIGEKLVFTTFWTNRVIVPLGRNTRSLRFVISFFFSIVFIRFLVGQDEIVRTEYNVNVYYYSRACSSLKNKKTIIFHPNEDCAYRSPSINAMPGSPHPAREPFPLCALYAIVLFSDNDN